jgi:hypothetical protein
MCAALPRSEYYQRVRLPRQLPARLRVVLSAAVLDPVRRIKTAVDLSGSLTLPFLRMPCSQTPPQSPATIAFIGSLLLPSRFSTLSACGFQTHEALSLHLRYGPRIALSTLNPCRCLHVPKTRFPVGRLFPLAGAGISPAGSVRLSLTHRKTFPGPHPPRPAGPTARTPARPTPRPALAVQA